MAAGSASALGLSMNNTLIPVVLFTYKRTNTLIRTLNALKANLIPLLIIYSDGARTTQDLPQIQAVRQILSDISWCKTELHFRDKNCGLGKNILSGVTEVLEHHEACIVFEDDIICVPGTYRYFCEALLHYNDDPRVMSITSWTNRQLVPSDVTNIPYFDGRAECMTWGTWRRAWKGMANHTALDLMEQARRNGTDPYFWGGDLPFMAKSELTSNIWAVRFCYHHIVHGGLCLRPPWSMSNHIGWGNDATNAAGKNWEDNGELQAAPPIPEQWPIPCVHPACAAINRKMYPRPWSDRFPRLVPFVRKVLAKLNIKV